MPTKTLRGIGASEGIAIGPVLHYEVHKLSAQRRQVDDGPGELARLEAALEQARQEVHALFERAREEVGANEAGIFEAHEMFLSDPELLEQVQTLLQTEMVNAEYAWQAGTDHYAAALRAIGDEYLAARAADVEDVAQRVLRLLSGVEALTATLKEPVVIVAEVLAPSDTVTLDQQKVLAFCTATGGPTSHVAILAKSLGIPAVVGLGEAIRQLPDATQLIVDGGEGLVIMEPDAALLAAYHQRGAALSAARSGAMTSASEPAITLDGKRIEVVANIGSPEEAVAALEYGAEGVGLLRTEFLFLDREIAPDEDEQEAVYRHVLETMGKRPVVVRTLDIGGDKPAPYLALPPEMNPFLGIRGARLSLAQPALFQEQLRALLRAGEGHTLKIMCPMISTLEEVFAVRKQLEQAQAALEARGVSYARSCEIGIMVEVPAAALIADALAEAVDFFSIGTNDLTQYTLAADRTSAKTASLADALHPAVLRLVRMVIEAAHARQRWVGLCGELAGNPLATPVLLGLGLDEFSMSPRSIPLVKGAIRRFRADEARDIAMHALSLGTAAGVRAYLESLA